MRKAKIVRKTRETQITMELNLDGTGRSDIRTPLPFLSHMLTLFAHHSGFDLKIRAGGDIEVDAHHLTEDLGIVAGQSVLKALADKKGIARYASVSLPMDEALVDAALDISGRPYLGFSVGFGRSKKDEFDFELIEEFFRSLVTEARLTLHMRKLAGKNNHHIAEAAFKGFARALGAACRISSNKIPSTKGIL